VVSKVSEYINKAMVYKDKANAHVIRNEFDKAEKSFKEALHIFKSKKM
jgi:hypothetical protein